MWTPSSKPSVAGRRSSLYALQSLSRETSTLRAVSRALSYLPTPFCRHGRIRSDSMMDQFCKQRMTTLLRLRPDHRRRPSMLQFVRSYVQRGRILVLSSLPLLGRHNNRLSYGCVRPSLALTWPFKILDNSDRIFVETRSRHRALTGHNP
jgi:hypothetical protein